jgi:hypothetical protein
MKPDLDLTSVPGWTVQPSRPPADTSGRSWTIIAFESYGAEVDRDWQAQIAAAGRPSEVNVHQVADGAAAVDVLRADLAAARVGWRLMMAGPAHACLSLRAEAVALGVADDEMTVATGDVATRPVQCVHCLTVTHGQVALEGVLPCAGCGRNLLVHYHVSRRRGAHLGYQVDAEVAPA